jgi:hypothetical protein
MNIILTISSFLIVILGVNHASSVLAQEENNSVMIPLGAVTPNNPTYYIPPEITISSGTTII